MQTNNPQRSPNICRACMSSDNFLHEIYELGVNSIQILTMFVSTTMVSIEPDDALPKQICAFCLNSLVSAYQFQQKCMDSDMKLRARLPVAPERGDDQVQETLLPIVLDFVNVPKQEAQPILDKGDTAISCREHPSSEPLKEIIKEEDILEIEKPYGEPKTKHDIVEEGDESLSEDNEENKNTDEISLSNSLECPVCLKTFDRKYRLKRHLNVHNEVGKPFECEVCKQRFSSGSNLTRHSIVHSEKLSEMSETINRPEDFKCTECSKVFWKQESLSSHMRTHKDATKSKEYRCEFCPKVYSRLNLLTRHVKSHKEMRQHMCKICGKTFALGAQLIDHINRHNGIKPHVCPICDKGFQQSCTLKDHMRTHSGEQPFLCFECGKAFNNGSNLRQHLIRHTGVKPFQCPECPSRFTCKGGLKSHMATHSTVKPYICDMCGSAFTKPYSLAKHKRIHTGERPYSCDVCDMRFNSSDHVKRHMRTHTGEKPYACKFCDRAFAQSNDLVKHMRAHVGENTYQCHECAAAFRLNSELKVHIQQHFKQQKVTESSDTNSNSQDSLVTTTGVSMQALNKII